MPPEMSTSPRQRISSHPATTIAAAASGITAADAEIAGDERGASDETGGDPPGSQPVVGTNVAGVERADAASTTARRCASSTVPTSARSRLVAASRQPKHRGANDRDAQAAARRSSGGPHHARATAPHATSTASAPAGSAAATAASAAGVTARASAPVASGAAAAQRQREGESEHGDWDRGEQHQGGDVRSGRRAARPARR